MCIKITYENTVYFNPKNSNISLVSSTILVLLVYFKNLLWNFKSDIVEALIHLYSTYLRNKI